VEVRKDGWGVVVCDGGGARERGIAVAVAVRCWQSVAVKERSLERQTQGFFPTQALSSAVLLDDSHIVPATQHSLYWLYRSANTDLTAGRGRASLERL
jgi:hypothetical protein